MCQPILELPDYIGSELSAFGAYTANSFQNTCRYFGRKIDLLCSETLPSAAIAARDISLDLLKSYFFVMPSLAFGLGHYNDIGISSLICGIAIFDWIFRDRDVRDASVIFVGVPLAITLAIRIGTFVSMPTSYTAVSVMLQTICIAKLILIAKGDSTN